MDPEEFEAKNQEMTAKMASDTRLQEITRQWMTSSALYEYGYHFTWLGRPIIQTPQDMIAMQEIIWRVQPELIIETGIARGGSLIFYASILELIGKGEVLGIDIDIRDYNRPEIEKHPMFKRITMIEGSSISEEVVQQVRKSTENKNSILVCLDSNHTHDHVLKEIEYYSPLVTKGSYLVVFDTIIEDMPGDFYPDRPWGKGNNPKTAVWKFLKTTNRFEIDKDIERKLLVTSAPDGFLRCVKEELL